MGDVVAGLTVVAVLIPQSVAYAELAGLPPHMGLYAAALPPLAAAFWASSRYLQTGPVAMTALLTFGALHVLAEPSSTAYLKLAILLAVVVGVFRVALGLARLGVLAYFMSQPVVMGFTSAATLVIIATQVPIALGVEPSEGENIFLGVWDAITHPADWDLTAVALALVAIVLVYGARRVHPLFPGVLVAVAGGILFSVLTDYQGFVVGDVPGGLPPFSFAMPWSSLTSVIVPGAVIALIGFAEASSISRVYATRDRQRWSPNRELISQGVANLASGISGGFPVGGSFSRTSVNHQSGARTRWSGAVTGIAVFAFLPFAGVLSPLPRAILAVVVIAAVTPLVKIPSLIRLIRQSWGQAFVAWSTAILTVVLVPRVDVAVVIGVALAVIVHLRREMKITVDTGFVDHTLVLRPTGVLFYATAAKLNDALLEQLAAHPDAETLLLDLSRLGRVDYSGVLVIQSFAHEAADAGLAVRVEGVPPQSAGILKRVWPEMPTE